MGYLLTEIVVYLVIAGLIGFVFGWLVRDGKLDKYFKIFKNSSKLKEEVVPVVNNEEKEKEESVIETIAQSSQPTLLSQAPESGADKLSTIKGIGPAIEKKLNVLGIYTFEQIASWETAQEIWIVKELAFPISISKEAWVKQAQELLEAEQKNC